MQNNEHTLTMNMTFYVQLYKTFQPIVWDVYCFGFLKYIGYVCKQL